MICVRVSLSNHSHIVLHSAYIAVTFTVGTSQRKFSDNTLSFFTLQFWRGGRKEREGGKRFEIIEPSASKSLKTKVFFS